MRRVTVRLRGAVLAGAVLAAGALGAVPARSQERSKTEGADLVMRSEIPAAGAALAETLSTRWKWLGKAQFSNAGDRDPETAWRESVAVQEALGESGSARRAPGDASGRWLAVHLETGDEFEVELPLSFLREVGKRSRAAGSHLGSTGPGPGRRVLEPRGDEPRIGELGLADEPHQPLGWSDGDDTRTRRFDNTVYPYRAMGQIGGGTLSGCSGTLIGRRHVLTAAHCLWNVDSDSWSTGFRFRPGREGTCNNASCEPYGEYTAIWFFTPVEFRQTESFTYDYGIAVTSGFPGNLTGWLGYVGISQDLTNDYCDMVPFGPGYLGGSCFNRGYPACGFVENASLDGGNCKQGWAYQDLWPCEVGSFSSTGPDGWKAIFKTNCDIGRGHSGSAVFINNYKGSGKVVIGVVSYQNCATCGSADDYPNGIRRVTPDVLDWISYFKTVKFP